MALTAVGPVGLDVERITEVDVDGLSRGVLHADEEASDLVGFFTYWTRKEAVVKATGEGLTAPLAGVRVSSPRESPRLLAYPGRDVQAQMLDLRPDDDYRAAVAVLSDGPVEVEERRFINARRESGTGDHSMI